MLNICWTFFSCSQSSWVFEKISGFNWIPMEKKMVEGVKESTASQKWELRTIECTIMLECDYILWRPACYLFLLTLKGIPQFFIEYHAYVGIIVFHSGWPITTQITNHNRLLYFWSVANKTWTLKLEDWDTCSIGNKSITNKQNLNGSKQSDIHWISEFRIYVRQIRILWLFVPWPFLLAHIDISLLDSVRLRLSQKGKAWNHIKRSYLSIGFSRSYKTIC